MIDAKEFIELMLRHGWPVIVALFVYRAINLIFDWLGQSVPTDKLRGILNRRRRLLEQMLTLTYLSRETRNLARAELNTLSRNTLTGFNDPRLQEKLVQLCCRYNLPARYFTRWRTYLSEEDDLIVFAHRRHRFVWRFFLYVNLPLSSGYMFFMCYLFTRAFGLENLTFIIGMNAGVWYFPWLYITSPMAPGPTAKMKEYLRRFNSRSS